MTGPCSSAVLRERGAGTLRVRRHSSPGAFKKLEAEWTDLLSLCRPAHPFYAPFWHALWWKHCGQGEGGELLLLEVRESGGGLAAVAPLWVDGDGVVRFTGGEDLTDYADLVASPQRNAAAWRAVLDFLAAPAAPAWRSVELHALPEDSPTLAALAGAVGPWAEAWERGVEERCPAIALPESWEAYLGTLSGKARHELRRKVRRANYEAELLFREAQEETLEEDLETFFRLHALSHAEKERFWNSCTRAFFRAAARAALERGWLRLTFLLADGEPVAASFGLVYGGWYYLYNSGFDPARKELSTGLVLLAHNIEGAIGAGLAEFDFLRGTEPYKYRFGASDRTTFALTLRRAGP
ncbi:MAG: GNAT family N-acetyltransferase [Nitrospinota bacterium]